MPKLAPTAVRRDFYADWLTDPKMTDEIVAQYGAERFKSRDRITRKQRIHPLFV